MYLRNSLLLFTGVFGLAHQAISQKHIEVREQTWVGYFNQSRFTDRSGIWVDLHYRLTDDFIRERTIAIARFAYLYYLSDNVRLMAGYAFAPRFSAVGVSPIPEHRPWQQIQWIEKKKGFNLSQSLRIEQRFRRNVTNEQLAEEYDFNWRFRYNFSCTIPLTKSEASSKFSFLIFGNDIHINAGKNVNHNYFDQNRLSAAFGYHFTPELNAHLGYMFIFQQDAAAGHYLHLNVIRLFVIHQLDFRNNE